ncbi:flagellar hook-associated protein FlgK [Salipaludibacillus aurantiacus]|uniref:Flagellar hook-associated protein 1 n=1 Tax=Salipaludibacillus aurantiacus TaxID=1601833 RepID=A0A1H9W8M9_9BACI|nr:flagellar hook-associated protein FlgK [Salipaludibacillus aurantiacus]SES30248.1 flagellar hook-associated protein 1 FlgK [Salipaludibacillus aurantiacus]
MLSTFHGLETSRRALSTQQAALHTTGHNIANANTKGYSRQRVNFTQTEAFPNPAFNKPGIPGQIGTGVKPGEIQRVRESFLDMQYRAQNTKNGYWDTRHTALQKMEDIMNEPTEDGIANTLDRFWESLQDLSVNPEDSGARSVVRQRGIAVAETFNYTYNSLEAIQRDYKEQLTVQNNQIDSLTRQINDLNGQIASVEPHGMLPNDLYDKRDQLIDELSQFVNIEVERVPSGGQAKDMADGKYTVHLLDSKGQRVTQGGESVKLVNGENLTRSAMTVNTDDDTGLVTGVTFDNYDPISFETEGQFNTFTSGALKAVIETHGYMEEDSQRGDFPHMMQQLDTMAAAFAAEFNEVHQSGWSLSEIEAANDPDSAFTKTGFDFFAYSQDLNDTPPTQAAKFLKVSDDVMASLDNIAASGAGKRDGDGNFEPRAEAFAGDGSNALALADVKDARLSFGENTTNVQSFYQGIIGQMAVDTNEAGRMERNTASLKNSVDENRKSVSSVSLDEEMTNMIQFQHAYNAAARNLTAIDEMLDRIINGMGVVGR